MMRRMRQHGFTLLELTLVMVIACIVLAVAAPSLRGWSRESALRNAADDLVAVTRLARAEAITKCKTYRLCVPAEGGYYLKVLEGTVFLPVSSDFGIPAELGQGLRIELAKDVVTPTESRVGLGQSRMGYGRGQAGTDQTEQMCIDFFPNGRTEPAMLRVVSEQAGTIQIACASPAEPFEIVTAGAGY